jgi:hypothetical protein
MRKGRGGDLLQIDGGVGSTSANNLDARRRYEGKRAVCGVGRVHAGVCVYRYARRGERRRGEREWGGKVAPRGTR